MSDVSGVSAGGSQAQEPASAWLSFEHRMRQRRLARCLQHAETAMDERRFADAQSAIAEARELDPDSPPLLACDERLRALLVSQDDAPSGRSVRRVFALAAGLVVIAAGAAFGAWYWNSFTPQEPAQAIATASLPDTASTPETATPQPAVEPEEPRLQIVYETVSAAESVPRIESEPPPLPGYPGPPIAEPEPQPPAEPVALAVNRADATAAPPAVPPDIRLDPIAPPPPPIEPPARLLLGLDPAAVPAARIVPPPAVEAKASSASDSPATEISRPSDESAFVRAVLDRYERAYSSLDAAAASAIWPGVNRSALARAFQGLASQRVSLGDCDVLVNGPAARATCSGTATWQPKVGGGIRTEPRQWSFDLRKSGEAWRIERAIAK
jgi:hypothetical protein